MYHINKVGDFLRMLLDKILECVCVVVCLIHAVVGYLHSRHIGKKVDALCLKCGQPIEQGVEHKCDLDDVQLDKLVDFVKSIKENK